MANDSNSQQALARDAGFQLRLQNALMTVAWQILNESSSTPGHAQRATYARQVISDPAAATVGLAPSFVTRPNVINFTTSTVFQSGGVSVITASGDADMQSQLNTDWYAMSGASSS